MKVHYENRDGQAVRVTRSWGQGSRGTVLNGLPRARIEKLLRMGMVEVVETEEVVPPKQERKRGRVGG